MSALITGILALGALNFHVRSPTLQRPPNAGEATWVGMWMLPLTVPAGLSTASAKMPDTFVRLSWTL